MRWQVLCEVLAGVNSDVVAPLLQSALEAYSADVPDRGEGDGGRGQQNGGEETERKGEKGEGGRERHSED